MMNEDEITITLTLNGPQSRALARAVKFYTARGNRPADRPLLKAVAEQVLYRIEEKAYQDSLPLEHDYLETCHCDKCAAIYYAMTGEA